MEVTGAAAEGSQLGEAERANSTWPEYFETSKLILSDILPPKSPCLLLPLKQLPTGDCAYTVLFIQTTTNTEGECLSLSFFLFCLLFLLFLVC